MYQVNIPKRATFAAFALCVLSTVAFAKNCARVRAWEEFAAPYLATKGPTSTLDSYEELVPLYKSEAFLKMAGKAYGQLSYAERFKLGKLVSKCSSDSFLRALATYPLFERDSSAGHREMLALLAEAPLAAIGMARFQKSQSEKEQRLFEARTRLEAEGKRKAEPLEPIPHKKGDLILNGTLARLYFNRDSNHKAPSDCQSLTPFSLVFKAETRERITLTEEGVGEYIRSEIEPAARRVCPSLGERRVLRMNVFFEGVHLAGAGSRGFAFGADISPEDIRSQRAKESVFAILGQGGGLTSAGKAFPLKSTSLFKIAPDRLKRKGVDLLSLSAFRVARARAFKSEELYAAEQNLLSEQRALLGDTIDDLKVWAVIKGGEYAYGSSSLFDADMRGWAHALVQTSGQAVIAACGNDAFGGTYVHEFKLIDPGTRNVQQTFEVTLLKDLGDAGHAVRGEAPISKLSLLFRDNPWFDYEVNNGPARDAFDNVLAGGECDSELLQRLHRNILVLVDHHSLK